MSKTDLSYLGSLVQDSNLRNVQVGNTFQTTTTTAVQSTISNIITDAGTPQIATLNASANLPATLLAGSSIIIINAGNPAFNGTWTVDSLISGTQLIFSTTGGAFPALQNAAGGTYIYSINSPINYSNAIIGIKIPDRAIELLLNSSSDLRISESPSMASYDIVMATTKEAISCAKLSILYIVRNNFDGILNFRFTLI